MPQHLGWKSLQAEFKMPRITCSHCHMPWVKSPQLTWALSCQSLSCYLETETEQSIRQSNNLDLSLQFSQVAKFKVQKQGIREKVRRKKPQRKAEITKQLCLVVERKSCAYSSCSRGLNMCALFQEAELCTHFIKMTPIPNDCKEHFFWQMKICKTLEQSVSAQSCTW